MLSLTETKLDVDYILVQNAGKPVKSVKANFFTNAWHEIYSFFTCNRSELTFSDRGARCNKRQNRIRLAKGNPRG